MTPPLLSSLHPAPPAAPAAQAAAVATTAAATRALAAPTAPARPKRCGPDFSHPRSSGRPPLRSCQNLPPSRANDHGIHLWCWSRTRCLRTWNDGGVRARPGLLSGHDDRDRLLLCLVCRRRRRGDRRNSVRLDPSPPHADVDPGGVKLPSLATSLPLLLLVARRAAPDPQARPVTRFHSSSNGTSFQPESAGM